MLQNQVPERDQGGVQKDQQLGKHQLVKRQYLSHNSWFRYKEADSKMPKRQITKGGPDSTENKEIPPAVHFPVSTAWFAALPCLSKVVIISGSFLSAVTHGGVLGSSHAQNSSEDMFLITNQNISYPCFVFPNNATALIFPCQCKHH